MIKFRFIARSGDESIPLTVALEYQPGNQTQRARRLAAGELLAILAAEEAHVDAREEGLVTVRTGENIWVIGEARAAD